jgi:hypothetical protein
MCLMTVCRRAKTRSTGDLTSHMVAKLLYNNNPLDRILTVCLHVLEQESLIDVELFDPLELFRGQCSQYHQWLRQGGLQLRRYGLKWWHHVEHDGQLGIVNLQDVD